MTFAIDKFNVEGATGRSAARHERQQQLRTAVSPDEADSLGGERGPYERIRGARPTGMLARGDAKDTFMKALVYDRPNRGRGRKSQPQDRRSTDVIVLVGATTT